MKKHFLTFLTIIFTLSVFLLSPLSVFADTNYGDGSYGSGAYNVGETTDDDSGDSDDSSDPTSSSLSDASAPGCDQPSPGNQASWLYGAIANGPTSVTLYFTEAGEPVSNYVLEYGFDSGNYQFGVSDMEINERHQMTYQVKSLSPNTTYYFRIRSDNGCATGPYSNEISVTTKKISLDFSNLYLTDSTITKEQGQSPEEDEDSEGQEQEEQQEEQEVKGYEVNVLVVDKDSQPVSGAKVTLHSDPKEAYTGEDGIAHFTDVEQGEHQVLIAYDNYEGEQSIFLTGDDETEVFNVNVTVEEKMFSTQVLVLLGVMAGVIVVLSVFLVRAKRKKLI